MGYVFPHANCEDKERYTIRNNLAGTLLYNNLFT